MQHDLDVLRRILRAQAWQRAKGELESIRQTFYGENVQEFHMSEAIEKFVKQVEDNGLAE